MAKKYFKMAASPAICLIEETDQPEPVPVLFNDGPRVDEEDKVNVWSD
jgi:hypothetical protein